MSSVATTNNNDESDSDVLKIDEDGDYTKENKENNNEGKEGTDDDIAEVENENGMDDSEEEIAMGNKEIVERTGNKLLFFCTLFHENFRRKWRRIH